MSRSSHATRLVVVLLAALTFAAPVAAQPRSKLRWLPAAGVHAGGPAGAALALGGFRVTKAGDTNSGYLVLLEPGLGAGKLRAGIATVGGFFSGFSLQAIGLRTWAKPRAGREHTTYAGVEGHVMFLVLNVGASAVAPLTTTGGQRGLVTLTAGLGF